MVVDRRRRRDTDIVWRAPSPPPHPRPTVPAVSYVCSAVALFLNLTKRRVQLNVHDGVVRDLDCRRSRPRSATHDRRTSLVVGVATLDSRDKSLTYLREKPETRTLLNTVYGRQPYKTEGNTSDRSPGGTLTFLTVCCSVFGSR